MADHPGFFDEIKAGVQEGFKLLGDGVSIRDLVILGGHIQGIAVHILATIDSPRDHLEHIIADCERAFDELLVPLDIPWVGGAVEKYIEAQVRASIRPGLTHLVEALGK